MGTERKRESPLPAAVAGAVWRNANTTVTATDEATARMLANRLQERGYICQSVRTLADDLHEFRFERPNRVRFDPSDRLPETIDLFLRSARFDRDKMEAVLSRGRHVPLPDPRRPCPKADQPRSSMFKSEAQGAWFEEMRRAQYGQCMWGMPPHRLAVRTVRDEHGHYLRQERFCPVCQS